jgi:signal transduction histidine kinase/CheY-like chemotaxis protein
MVWIRRLITDRALVRADSGRAYVLAILVVAVAILLQVVIDPYVTGAKFIILFSVIIGIGLVAGFRPGLLATGLGGLAVAYLFIPPAYSFAVTGLGDQLALALYALVGFVYCLVVRSLRRAVLELEEERRRQREAAAMLERRVAERTRELSGANAGLLATAERLRGEIVERERAQDQLRQAQKMEVVGQLTGGVAHDFNNLLTVIIGQLDWLGRQTHDLDDRLRSRLMAAQSAAERAASLTQRLLAFSRRQPLMPRLLDSNRVIGDMDELLRRTLGEQIALETVLAAGLWRIEADQSQLESALLNLAINARDAMPEGGRLTIEAANCFLDEAYAESHAEVTSGQHVMIAVTDTGTGMSPEVLEHVFEPFFTTKDIGRGTGLGLSQLYGFVKQSGGHVNIYSEVGAGTTVKLYFRRAVLATEPRGEPVAQRASEPCAAVASSTLLLVEDDPLVRLFGATTLEDGGYTVIEAHDGLDALAKLDEHPEVSLLVTDVGLPGGMTGRVMADEARRRRPDLRVIFTTGYARNAIVHNGVLDPGLRFLGKPFTAEMLLRKVAEALLDDAA